MFNGFTTVNMTANGSVPLSRLNIFALRPFLQKNITTGVEDMYMNHWMKQIRISMNCTARCFSDHFSCRIDNIKHLFPGAFFLQTPPLEYCPQEFEGSHPSNEQIKQSPADKGPRFFTHIKR